MSAPRFTIVIPTRERTDALRSALRTCLDQTFGDYEVIVSDNHSSPATRAAVDEADSPKVRYVRTAEPGSVSANWEFGVSHARGEFVTVLGDDDGLLPHALTEADRLAREYAARAVRWEVATYTQPNISGAGHGNFLRVPLGRGAVVRDGAGTIRAVAQLREPYEELPTAANSIVHRDVLDELRRRTGKVFAHHVADVYSGFAVAHTAGRFVATTVPMAVRGVSGRRARVEQEYHAIDTKDGLHRPAHVPRLPVLCATIADAYLFARGALFPTADSVIDRKELARASVTGARTVAENWPAVLAEARRSVSDDPALLRWFDAELAGAPFNPPPAPIESNELGYSGSALHLDVAPLGVTDVAGAALLCDRILGYRDRAVKYTAAGDIASAALKINELTTAFGPEGEELLRRALGWGAAPDSNRDLQFERDALLAVCAERGEIIARLDAELRAMAGELREERGWSLKRPFRGVKKAFAKLTKRAA